MQQHQVKVNGKEFILELEKSTKGTVNGKPFDLDVTRVSETIYHVIRDFRSYEVELLGEGNVRVNGTLYATETVNRFDALLKQLGMDKGAVTKVASVKAPMPGLVFKVLAAVGDVVQKGDTLLVLEAMKMENVIKSPTDGTIVAIEVQQGNTVEKNQVMVRFA